MKGFRGWMSLIFGLALLALGGIPLLNSFGLIGFTIPAVSVYVLRILFVVAGIFMLWDAAHETIGGGRFFMWMSILFGVPIILLGILPLLNTYGVISLNLAFLTLSTLMSNIMTAFAGLLLIVDAFKATRL
jgi:energy-converting hydrogenase Eha subunit A